MFKRVLVNFKNQKGFFVKLSSLIFSLTMIVSLFVFCFFSFTNTINYEEIVLGSKNYYVCNWEKDYQPLVTNLNESDYQDFSFTLYNLDKQIYTFDNEPLNMNVSLRIADESNFLPNNTKKALSFMGEDYLLEGRLANKSSEICIPQGFASMICGKKSLGNIDLLGKELTLSGTGKQSGEIKASFTIVGIFNVNIRFFDQFLQVTQLPFSNQEEFISFNRHLIFMNDFTKIEETNQKIEELNISCTYMGSYSLYTDLVEIWDYAKIVYYYIAIPFSIGILSALFVFVSRYVDKEKILFSQMMIFGYSKKKIALFVVLQLFIISFVSLALDVGLCLGFLYIIKAVLSSMYYTFIITPMIVLQAFSISLLFLFIVDLIMAFPLLMKIKHLSIPTLIKNH